MYQENGPARLTIVGDKECINLASLIGFSNTYPDAFRLGGVITPGGDFDGLIEPMVKSLKGMRKSEGGLMIPVAYGDSNYWVDRVFVGGGNELHASHAAFDPQRLRAEKDAYRDHYCEDLLIHLRRTGPEVVFLDNFKLIVNNFVVSEYPNKMVNVHPSVLPEHKGFRPEIGADRNGDLEAIGYTFHLVAEDLDGGPTLLQQKVRMEPYDQNQAGRMGKDRYGRLREELLRLKIIEAQAEYTPGVLAFIAADAPQKIIEDQEAFAIEGREKFIESEGYLKSLEKDHDEWVKKGHKFSFERWRKNIRKPYQRVLFDMGHGWQTLEQILRVPEYSPIPTPSYPLHHYEVFLGGSAIGWSYFADLEQAGKQMQEQGEGGKVHFIGADEEIPGRITILASIDLCSKLGLLGVDYRSMPRPTIVVGVPREPIQQHPVDSIFRMPEPEPLLYRADGSVVMASF